MDYQTPNQLPLKIQSQVNLTGTPKAPSVQSTTKVNADHAGLSQPLKLSKVFMNSPREHTNNSQFNKLLIVLNILVLKDATEDTHNGLMNMFKNTVLKL